VVAGRLPSLVLGLHLEQQDGFLRLYNPATGQWLATPEEVADQEKAARRRAEVEAEGLRREVEELRRRLGGR
jgi:hypothetical protein